MVVSGWLLQGSMVPALLMVLFCISMVHSAPRYRFGRSQPLRMLAWGSFSVVAYLSGLVAATELRFGAAPLVVPGGAVAWRGFVSGFRSLEASSLSGAVVCLAAGALVALATGHANNARPDAARAHGAGDYGPTRALRELARRTQVRQLKTAPLTQGPLVAEHVPPTATVPET
jgi:hypothetical protein